MKHQKREEEQTDKRREERQTAMKLPFRLVSVRVLFAKADHAQIQGQVLTKTRNAEAAFFASIKRHTQGLASKIAPCLVPVHVLVLTAEDMSSPKNKS
jgi:hypothetical protein